MRLPTTSSVGVHEVRLTPVTDKGQEVGTPLSFSLRTSQVGRLIWYVILAGGVLLGSDGAATDRAPGAQPPLARG